MSHFQRISLIATLAFLASLPMPRLGYADENVPVCTTVDCLMTKVKAQLKALHTHPLPSPVTCSQPAEPSDSVNQLVDTTLPGVFGFSAEKRSQTLACLSTHYQRRRVNNDSIYERADSPEVCCPASEKPTIAAEPPAENPGDPGALSCFCKQTFPEKGPITMKCAWVLKPHSPAKKTNTSGLIGQINVTKAFIERANLGLDKGALDAKIGLTKEAHKLNYWDFKIRPENHCHAYDARSCKSAFEVNRVFSF